MIQIRVELEPIKEEDFYGFIDRIHNTFARNILEEAKKASPVESGELRESWVKFREDVHTTHIYPESDHAGYLLGTGIWGPREEPFCSKTIVPVTDPMNPIKLKPMIFPWRFKNYEVQARTCVRGINPRAIRGDPGVIYDFAADMENAVIQGVEKSVQEMNE